MKNILLFILLIFTASGLWAQTECTVKIVFAVNKSNPPGYTFSIDPKIEGAKYFWSFGDNSNSDSPTPTHSFKITDTYNISVKVSKDEKVCYGELKTRFEGGTNTASIFSGKGKVVNMASTAGCGLAIVLDNGTTIIPVEKVSDFVLKEGQYLEIVYELLKDKTIECKAGAAVKIIKVFEIVPPCRIAITFIKNTTTPVSYTFKTDAQPEGSKYLWYFGESGKSEQASPTFTFPKSGSFIVKLRVIDSNNKVCYGEIKETFQGLTNPVLAGRGKVKKLTTPGCEYAIIIENTGMFIPAKMNIDFQFRDGQYIEFTYEKMADKITTCTEGIDVKILTIKEITTTDCKAYFTATNELWSNQAMLKKMVFSNLSTGNIKECLWKFGDNTTSTELKPVHEYTTFGEYRVCLLITTVDGCKSDYCATVKVVNNVENTECKFDLVIKPKEATPNTFLFSTVCPVEIKTWKWNFGDGKTSDAKNPEHAYEKAGTYEVSCIITTASGCTATRTIRHNVLAAPLPACSGAISLVLFDPTNNTCNGKAIAKLIDLAGAEIAGLKYAWTDGKTGSTVENLCFDRTYTVQAIVEGVCQKNTSFNMLSKPIWKASTQNGKSSFIVIAPVEEIKYEWNFGNGMVMTGSEVNYNFKEDGTYNVTLKAISGNNVSEYTQQVVVMNNITQVYNLDISKVKIHPNPVKDMLMINFDGPAKGIHQIDITNITGQRVYTQTLNNDGISQLTVNVQNLKSGIYFLRITNGKQLIADQKFIKAN